MSASLYRWSEACEGRECPGDCDHCHENEEDEDDIQTRVQELPVVLSNHIRQAQMREGRQAAIDVCRAPHMRNADCSDFEDDEM